MTLGYFAIVACVLCGVAFGFPHDVDFDFVVSISSLVFVLDVGWFVIDGHYLSRQIRSKVNRERL